jgi:long-chain acyl-CoA synthetase
MQAGASTPISHPPLTGGDRPWLAHYEAGVPPDIAVPALTVDGLLRRAAQEHPDRTALIFFGARTSYRQLDAAVDRFAHVLRGMGLAHGDRVSLHLPTSPAFVIAFMGALRAGAVLVPMSPLYVERELGILFAETRPSVAVTLDALVPRLRSLTGGPGVPDRMIVTGIQDSLPIPLRWLYPIKARRDGTWRPQPHAPETPNLFRLLREAPTTPFASAAVPDDLAVLQPTGGTTGTPKAAMLTHRNLVANAEQVAVWFPGAEEFPVVLAPLPFFHIYGLTVDLDYAMLRAGTLILLPRFDPHQVFAAIAKYRPSLFPGAPIMYQTLANHPDAAKYDLHSIRACISGAAPLAPEVQNGFEAATGGRVVEGYGLTEASPVTHCNPVMGDRRNGTIGLPFPGTEARVVRPGSGEPLPVGEVGELEVRGPQVMNGYWERPEETAAVLHDGWLCTGDMARMSEDGYFTIVDRKKDLVIVGGMNVYPREVEEVLLSHPAVREAAVIGVAEERHGEVPRAFVALKPGASVTPEELMQHCEVNLARFKVPRIIELRPELPKTMIGKVLRRDLRAEVERRAAGNDER